MTKLFIAEIIERTAEKTSPYVWSSPFYAEDMFAPVLNNEVTSAEELRSQLLETSGLDDTIWELCEGELADKSLIDNYAHRFDMDDPAAETEDGESVLFETLRTTLKESAINWANQAVATFTEIINEKHERYSTIQTQLAAESDTVCAYYHDGRAIVLYKDADGDYFTNTGVNEFTDDNESAETITWHDSEWQGSEADGRNAFNRLVAAYGNHQ